MIWPNDEFFLDLCFLDSKGKIWCYACVLAPATFLNSLDQKYVFSQVLIFGNCPKVKLFYQTLFTTAPRQEIPTWKTLIWKLWIAWLNSYFDSLKRTLESWNVCSEYLRPIAHEMKLDSRQVSLIGRSYDDKHCFAFLFS